MISDAVYSLVFYVFAAMMAALAIGVVACKNLLRAAVCLMGVLLVGAGCYAMLGAQFAAGIQVLVYVGGIIVLIVFAVMLTQSVEAGGQAVPLYRHILAGGAAILFFACSSAVFMSSKFTTAASGSPDVTGTVEAVGRMLFDRGTGGYVLAFEIISLLLLAAAIGSIVVARKEPAKDIPGASADEMSADTKPIEKDQVLETIGGQEQ